MRRIDASAKALKQVTANPPHHKNRINRQPILYIIAHCLLFLHRVSRHLHYVFRSVIIVGVSADYHPTRQDDPQYADDPEFQRLSQELMDKLFTLSGNISRLSNEISLLGTKRDTERVRERVHELLEQSTDTFKDVGEGVKTIQAWEDVSVRTKPKGMMAVI